MSKKDLKRATESLLEYRDSLLRELDSLDHVIECSLKNYDFMIDFAVKMGFERVVDIGCAYGFQSELCRGRGIGYVGINTHELNFYQEISCVYAYQEYPFPIANVENDLAISNLALGWHCYQDEKDFEETCKALGKDFKASLLYIPQDRKHILFRCFNNVQIVDEKEGVCPTGFYYCWNSEQMKLNV